MATNIPPHNLGEVIDATIYRMDNPESTVLELMDYIKYFHLQHWWCSGEHSCLSNSFTFMFIKTSFSRVNLSVESDNTEMS